MVQVDPDKSNKIAGCQLYCRGQQGIFLLLFMLFTVDSTAVPGKCKKYQLFGLVKNVETIVGTGGSSGSV